MPSTVGMALMISDGVHFHALGPSVPRGKRWSKVTCVIIVNEIPVRFERATGLPDCKVTHFPVAELDLYLYYLWYTPTPDCLAYIAVSLPPAETEDCTPVLVIFLVSHN